MYSVEDAAQFTPEERSSFMSLISSRGLDNVLGACSGGSAFMIPTTLKPVRKCKLDEDSLSGTG